MAPLHEEVVLPTPDVKLTRTLLELGFQDQAGGGFSLVRLAKEIATLCHLESGSGGEPCIALLVGYAQDRLVLTATARHLEMISVPSG